MTKLLSLITVLISCLFMTTAQSEEIGRVYIDVRSVEEFSEGHLTGAVNIPHSQVSTGIKALNLDKNTEVFLYCRSGRRAGLAKAELKALGFSQVVNLETLAKAKEHAANNQ